MHAEGMPRSSSKLGIRAVRLTVASIVIAFTLPMHSAFETTQQTGMISGKKVKPNVQRSKGEGNEARGATKGIQRNFIRDHIAVSNLDISSRTIRSAKGPLREPYHTKSAIKSTPANQNPRVSTDRPYLAHKNAEPMFTPSTGASTLNELLDAASRPYSTAAVRIPSVDVNFGTRELPGSPPDTVMPNPPNMHILPRRRSKVELAIQHDHVKLKMKDVSLSTSPSSCNPQCTDIGTCHEEYGRCDCPMGRSGDACDVDATPSCQVSPSFRFPCTSTMSAMPCACAYECALFTNLVSHMVVEATCLETKNAQGGLVAVLLRPQELDQLYIFGKPLPNDKYMPMFRNASGIERINAAPLARCIASCSNHGWCEATLRCSCFPGWIGLRCEREELFFCPSSCQGHGVCNMGFCHCEPGFYGADCSLVRDHATNGSKLIWDGEEHRKVAVGVTVYVYELPPAFNAHGIAVRGNIDGDFGRPIGYALWDRLLNSHVRVADPKQADFFFVPVLGLRHIRRGVALAYIREHWPFWDESDKARHIWVGADDAGSCAYFSPYHPPPAEFTSKSIFLQHMGLRIGGNRGYIGTYKPLQDIVIPPFGISLFAAKPVSYYESDSRVVPLPRNITFLFVGSMYPESKHLPHNVRLQVQQHHAKRPGYYISEDKVDKEKYRRLLASSLFCMAASGKGGGWGMRFGSAVVAGCIPVIIMDNTTEVFEELLPMGKFTIQVQEEDIPNMHGLLENVQQDEERVASLQKELSCVYKYFLWTSIWGKYGVEDGNTDAFAALLEILRRRKTGEVRQWETACGQTMDHLIKPTPAPVRCDHDECCAIPQLRELARRSHSRGASWPSGGAACVKNINERSPPPC